MPRLARTDIGDYVYHVLNRANARVRIFHTDKDYAQFEVILTEAVEKYTMRLLAYCIMPNHWHLVLYPRESGDMGQFMGWLTNTHTRRWHAAKKTIGHGHLYQGRYKSFLCQTDGHFLTLARYVERNAKKANLVQRVEQWKWSSAWRREYGTLEQRKMLAEWPVEIPKNYFRLLNDPQTENEEQALERATEKGTPFGNSTWIEKIVKKFGLEQTLHHVGRPKKNR